MNYFGYRRYYAMTGLRRFEDHGNRTARGTALRMSFTRKSAGARLQL
jgi:hypothetical protein